MAMTSLPSIDLDVAGRLRADEEFRQAYFIAESSGMIARQLIRLRKRRGLSQTDVAKQLETRQPAISRVESADYRNWSFNTLRRLAEAMDARIRVIIEPSEDVLGEYETPSTEEKKSDAPPLSSQFNQWIATGSSHHMEKISDSILGEVSASATKYNYALHQHSIQSLFSEQLEGQKMKQTLGNATSEMTGAACS
jgi:transcriptional regulator with XRE-family HTH domain